MLATCDRRPANGNSHTRLRPSALFHLNTYIRTNVIVLIIMYLSSKRLLWSGCLRRKWFRLALTFYAALAIDRASLQLLKYADLKSLRTMDLRAFQLQNNNKIKYAKANVCGVRHVVHSALLNTHNLSDRNTKCKRSYSCRSLFVRSLDHQRLRSQVKCNKQHVFVPYARCSLHFMHTFGVVKLKTQKIQTDQVHSKY